MHFSSGLLRSENGLGPLTRRLAAWGVRALLVLGPALPLSASDADQPPTAAGTRITNQATVEFTTPSGETTRVVSDLVVLVVGQVAGVDVDPPRASEVLPGSRVVFSHDVHNLGNDADTFDVDASTPLGWPTAVYHDVDGDGEWSTADTLLTGPVGIDMSGTFPILVVVDVPESFGGGALETVVVSATSRFDGAVHDAVTDEIRSAATGLSLGLRKVVDRTEASAGDVLTYRLTIELEGTEAPGRVTVRDTVPAGTIYEAGTLRVDGVRVTDQPGDDAGRYRESAGVVEVSVGGPVTASEIRVEFQVRIDDLAVAGTRVVNRAAVVAETATGVARARSEPAITMIAAPGLVLSKQVSGSNPSVEGDSLVYLIDVVNPSATLSARDVEIVDTIPAGLDIVEVTPVGDVDDGVVRWRFDRLAPGARTRLRVVTEVGEVEDSVQIVNRAHLRSADAEGRDAASASVALVPGDTASIALDLEAEVVRVEIGGTVPIRVDVLNDGPVTVAELEVRLTLPEGTELIVGPHFDAAFRGLRSSPVDFGTDLGGPAGTPPASSSSPFQLDSFRVEGDTLYVSVPGELRPDETISFRYELLVRTVAARTLRSAAIAVGRRGSALATAAGLVVASNEDAVEVVLSRNRPLETRTTIGRVFEDRNGNGVQDPGEPGIARADVWTEDGSVVTTDADGKFSFVNLRPGRHAFRLDPESLPIDLRAAGSETGQALRVAETDGWTSGHVTFAVVSRRMRVVRTRAAQGVACPPELRVDDEAAGAAGPACAVAGEAGLRELSERLLAAATEPSGGAEGAVEARTVAPEVTVELAEPGRGARGAVFALPDGWSLAPEALAAGPTTPEVRTTVDGTRWMVWPSVEPVAGPLTLRLVPTSSGEASVEEEVRVAAARATEERVAARGSEFLNGPVVEIFSPTDGVVAPSNKLFLGVRGEPVRPVHLFRSDSLLAEVVLRPDGIHDFVGLELPAGPNLFRVRMVNSWGNEKWDSVHVHRSGDVASVLVEDAEDEVTLLADGRTVGRTRVRLLDAWGVPVVHRPFVTVAVDGATLASRDVDPSSVGHQLEADAFGWVTVELVGVTRPGRGRLLVEAGDAEQEIPLSITPEIRPLLLTGVGQISAGAGGEGFGALSARGRLDERTSITLSYDSRRLDGGRDDFARSTDPLDEGQYAILGDASEQRSVTASRYRFSAHVERGLDYLRFGDVQTSGFSDGLELGRYGRSVPGATMRLTTGGVVWRAFGASTSQALRQTQFRGAGTSGPFALGAGVLPGTEEVRLEVRAAENASRVLSERLLTRYVEYEIDYESGALLLKQPIPAADPSGNPVYLVLSYEGASGGPSRPVFGVRASADLQRFLGERADSVPVSFSAVRDGQAGSEFRLGALRAAFVKSGGARLSAEVALAEGTDSSDVATRLEGTLPLFGGRLSLTGLWTRVGDEFSNPANVALRAGTEELRAAAGLKLAGSELVFEHERQNFASRGLERSRTSVGVTRSLSREVDVEARFAGDASGAQGLMSASGAAEYELTWKPTERLELFGRVRDQLWNDGALASTGSHYGAGARVALTDKVSLEGRHTRVAPSEGAEAYQVSSIGVASAVRVGTKAWGSYQLAGGADGRTRAAMVGLNHQFHVGPSWRFQSMLERRTGVAGAAPGDPVLASPFEQPEDDYLAGNLGVEFAPDARPYRLSARGELKRGDALSSALFTLAGDVSFRSSLALLTRQHFVQRSQAVSGSQRYSRERSSLFGLALRPRGHDRINVLFKLEWRDRVNPFGGGVLAREGAEERLIFATEAVWTPSRDFELAARFAARSAHADAEPLAGVASALRSETQFLGMRSTWSANSWLAARVEARGLFSDLASGSVWDLAPGLVVRPVEALEVEAGYRFGTLQDADFAVKTGKGWYVTFATRVTEDLLPTAAAFWRARLGS